MVSNIIFVVKMMPPATKRVCGQVRRRRDMSDQLTCCKTLLVLKCWFCWFLNVIFVMKMMPLHTKCVCGQVRTRRDMSDQLTRSIRPMQSNRAKQGAFYTATKVSLMLTIKMMLMLKLMVE